MMEEKKPPTFEQPHFELLDAPDVRPLISLHRGHDGFITLHRKTGDNAEDFENLGAVRATELEGRFPQLLPVVDKDSYYSVNGMFREHRNAQSVRYLTAAFVDIDCETIGVTVAQAYGAIVAAQDEGVIPPASMITRSGRGLWAFWFLYDPKKPHLPSPAFPEKVRLWANIQRKIGDTFAVIGADAAARDVARITRIPGSVNTKANLRVAYWIQLATGGKPYLYSLGDLAAALNVRLPQPHPVVDATRKALAMRGRKGQMGRWLKARANFETLWEHRGKFKEGTRNNAIYVYASILRSQRVAEEVVYQECARLYADLDQSRSKFPPKQFMEAFTAGEGFNKWYRFGGIRNQTIADMLDVTPEESAILANWPPASKFKTQVQPNEKLTQAQQRDRRRGLLQKLLVGRDKGDIPPLRALAQYLEEQGLPSCPKTISGDLGALGIKNPRNKKPQRKSRQRKLFPF